MLGNAVGSLYQRDTIIVPKANRSFDHMEYLQIQRDRQEELRQEYLQRQEQQQQQQQQQQ